MPAATYRRRWSRSSPPPSPLRCRTAVPQVTSVEPCSFTRCWVVFIVSPLYSLCRFPAPRRHLSETIEVTRPFWSHNSLAFALSLLCLACQILRNFASLPRPDWGVIGGGNNQILKGWILGARRGDIQFCGLVIHGEWTCNFKSYLPDRRSYLNSVCVLSRQKILARVDVMICMFLLIIIFQIIVSVREMEFEDCTWKKVETEGKIKVARWLLKYKFYLRLDRNFLYIK